MRKLLVYLRAYLRESILGPLLKLMEATLDLIVPLVVAAVIDHGIAAADHSYILKMCLMKMCFLLGAQKNLKRFLIKKL